MNLRILTLELQRNWMLTDVFFHTHGSLTWNQFSVFNGFGMLSKQNFRNWYMSILICLGHVFGQGWC